MGRHATALIAKPWPYRCTQGVANRGGDLVDRRLSWAESRFRSLAVGYLRLWPTDPAGRADILTARLQVFAHLRGLALADTYIEHPNVSSREGAAFRTLIEALRRLHINIVIIPAEHFSRFGGMHRAMFTIVAVETGADVLVMSDRPRGAW